MAEKTNTGSVFVVDSSFLLSILLPDETVLASFKIYLDQFRKNQIIFKSSELLKYEICNSLKSAVKQKRISLKKALVLYSAFKLMKIEYADIDFKKALNFSIKHDLSFYDATYLFLAKTCKHKLLTLDQKLFEISS